MVFIAGQHLAESAHSDECSLTFTNFFFERGAKAVHICSSGEHCASAASFESIAANEFGMLRLEVTKSGQRKPTGPAIIERWRFADEVLCPAGNSRSHDVFTEIVANVSAGVCQAVWIKTRLGEQKKSSGFKRRSGHNDDFCPHAVIFHGLR